MTYNTEPSSGYGGSEGSQSSGYGSSEGSQSSGYGDVSSNVSTVIGNKPPGCCMRGCCPYGRAAKGI